MIPFVTDHSQQGSAVVRFLNVPAFQLTTLYIAISLLSHQC